VEAFRVRFEQVVAGRILDDDLIPKVDVDIPLDFSEINAKFYRIMKQMSPFGPQNMAPVFRTDEVVLLGESIVMKEKHLKFACRQVRSGHSFWAIGFGMARWAEHLRQGESFSICYTLEENHFNGSTSLQLYLKDIRIQDPQTTIH
jgi:single-stranded-DNA-specific exonuclease